jgi:hypothetical protein
MSGLLHNFTFHHNYTNDCYHSYLDYFPHTRHLGYFLTDISNLLSYFFC